MVMAVLAFMLMQLNAHSFNQSVFQIFKPATAARPCAGTSQEEGHRPGLLNVLGSTHGMGEKEAADFGQFLISLLPSGRINLSRKSLGLSQVTSK